MFYNKRGWWDCFFSLSFSSTFLIFSTLQGKKIFERFSLFPADGLDGLGAALQYFAEQGLIMEYDEVHNILGQGNFVLTMSEGKFGKGDHVAFYDLFRVEKDQIVEHWDIIQPIPEQSAWKNDNGKF